MADIVNLIFKNKIAWLLIRISLNCVPRGLNWQRTSVGLGNGHDISLLFLKDSQRNNIILAKYGVWATS